MHLIKLQTTRERGCGLLGTDRRIAATLERDDVGRKPEEEVVITMYVSPQCCRRCIFQENDLVHLFRIVYVCILLMAPQHFFDPHFISLTHFASLYRSHTGSSPSVGGARSLGYSRFRGGATQD